ncbi:hypothetical protein DNTS_009701, partial [Danionella cerebrum]
FKKEEGGFDENLTAHPLPQYSSERRPLSDRKEHKETFQSSTLRQCGFKVMSKQVLLCCTYLTMISLGEFEA